MRERERGGGGGREEGRVERETDKEIGTDEHG